jgi:hypothetical protein
LARGGEGVAGPHSGGGGRGEGTPGGLGLTAGGREIGGRRGGTREEEVLLRGRRSKVMVVMRGRRREGDGLLWGTRESRGGRERGREAGRLGGRLGGSVGWR